MFWLFTYVLLSIRAGMIPETVPVLFTPQRLLAVSAGAMIFYAAARHLVQAAAKPTLKTIVGTFAASVAAALTIRLGLDRMVSEEAASVSYSVRWTLVWTGYFGVWLIGTLAYFHRAPTVRPIEAKVPPVTTLTTALSAATATEQLAWDWLVDVLAVELAQSSVVDRRAIATRLITRAGYEEVDPIGTSAEVQNARARLARSIASRL
jgi:hypothetical protein